MERMTWDLTDKQRQLLVDFYEWLMHSHEMWEIEMTGEVGQYLRESGWIVDIEEA
jgi:hypothetical protein